MMTKNYRTMAMACIVTLALLMSSGVSFAQKKMQGSQGMMGTEMMSKLSPEEQEIAKKLMQKNHDKLMELHKKIFAKRAELNAVMAQEKFEPQKARTLVNELASLESDLTKNHLGMFIEMRQQGVSYYGTCMIGGRMGPCATGVGMGRGMMDGGKMMDGTNMKDGGRMMDQRMNQPETK